MDKRTYDFPLLMSAPMVNALLRQVRREEGGKTQTRRFETPILRAAERHQKAGRKLQAWVRETFATVNSSCGPGIAYRANEDFIQPEYDGEDEGAGPSFNYEKYPGEYSMWFTDLLSGVPGHSWTTPLHMPRWASRLTLLDVNICRERLGDISDDDARAEGASMRLECYGFRGSEPGWSMDWSKVGTRSKFAEDGKILSERDIALGGPKWAFASYWNDLHGPDAWDRDQDREVMVLTFRPVLANIDAGAA